MPQELVVILLQVLLKYGLPAFVQAKELLSKENVSAADWDALLARINKPYEDYIK